MVPSANSYDAARPVITANHTIKELPILDKSGNNFGKSCSIELLNYFKNNLKDFGLNVEINKPYAGGFITRNYGNPSKGTETIQIEINRKLYMNEDKISLNDISLLQEIFSKIFNEFNYSLKEAAE